MTASVPIVRKRGQTSPFTVHFDGPISGEIVLVVTRQSKPSAAATPVMTLEGTIELDGVSVTFQQTTDQADHVGHYFYEIDQLAGAELDTILEGDFILEQDRARHFEPRIWTPPIEPVDGSTVPIADTDLWDGNIFDPDDKWTYETRDSVRVIRGTFDTVASSWPRTLHATAEPISNHGMFWGGMRFSATIFVNLSRFYFNITECRGYGGTQVGIDHKTGTMIFYSGGQVYGVDGVMFNPTYEPTDVTGWAAGWYVLEFQFAPGANCQYRVYQQGAPSSWLDAGFEWPTNRYPVKLAATFDIPSAAIGDLSSFEWEGI